MLSELLPEFFPPSRPISLGTNPPWDHGEIAQWFLKRVEEEPPMHLRFDSKGFFGYKERRSPGWSFINGSTCWSDVRGEFLDVAVTVDGNIIFNDGFNAHALREMARFCGFTPKKERRIVPPTGGAFDANAINRLRAEMEYASNDSPFCSSYDQDAK